MTMTNDTTTLAQIIADIRDHAGRGPLDHETVARALEDIDARLRALEMCRGDADGKNRARPHVFDERPRAEAECLYCNVLLGYSR